MLRRIGPVILVTVIVGGCGSGNFISGNSVLTKGLTLPKGTNAIIAMKSSAEGSEDGSGTMPETDPGMTDVTFDTATLVMKEIKLYLPHDGSDDGESDDDDGFEIKLVGPFVVNLVDGSIMNLGMSRLDDDSDDDGVPDWDDDDDDNDGIPDDMDDDDDGDGIPDDEDQHMGELKIFDAVEIPAGIYHRIKFRVDPLTADEAPDHPMVGLSASITGTLNGVSFEFCSDDKADLEFRSEEGIVVTEGDGNVSTFLLTFDPASWFSGIDPSTGVLSDDQVLRMCGDDNPELSSMVMENLEQRIHLGRDEDGDGIDDDDDDEDDDDDDDDMSAP